MTDDRSSRGRKALNKGKSYERSVARRLGVHRVGQYGTKADIGDENDWIVAQVKVGASYPDRLDRWLREVPAKTTQLRALVIGDAPGRGHDRRELIVIDLTDFCDWFAADQKTCQTCGNDRPADGQDDCLDCLEENA